MEDETSQISGVYGIWCCDQVYVGASSDIIRRWGQHMRELRESRHAVPRLQALFDEYGACQVRFDILEETDSDKIFMAEKKWGTRYADKLLNRLPFKEADLSEYYRIERQRNDLIDPEWRAWLEQCAYSNEVARKELGLANGTFYRRIKSAPDVLTRLAMAALYEGLDGWRVGK
jgi:hypothetical protein